jgi:polyisoprenoid-binding protein YceI
METKKFKIESPESIIDWTGRKVTGSHNGTIGIKGGTLIVDEGKLTGGKFVIDTTSIKILDVTDADMNAQFAGHLESDDFFFSEKFPTATFEITAVTPRADAIYQIEGNLTIKDITEPVLFDAAVNISSEEVTASGKIVIDRTKYNMKFRSGNFFENLGDTLIYNEFELDVNIIAKAA